MIRYQDDSKNYQLTKASNYTPPTLGSEYKEYHTGKYAINNSYNKYGVRQKPVGERTVTTETNDTTGITPITTDINELIRRWRSGEQLTSDEIAQVNSYLRRNSYLFTNQGNNVIGTYTTA